MFNSRVLSVMSHASVMLMSIPGSFLVPLLIMLFSSDAVARSNAREALNVQLNLIISALAFSIVVVGFAVVLMLCGVAHSVFVPGGWVIQLSDLKAVTPPTPLTSVEIAISIMLCVISLLFAAQIVLYGLVFPVIAVCTLSANSNSTFKYPLLFSFIPVPKSPLNLSTTP
ncbi:MAG: DUF4870 domain-containing protein [Cyanobacteria bacterium]|nr:DUF4870 domain-containing protein [Cyanobacteriota bacterium]